MHRLQARTYVGQPGETVTIGQVSVTLDGQPLGGGTFTLPAGAGNPARLQIGLFGPIGAACKALSRKPRRVERYMESRYDISASLFNAFAISHNVERYSKSPPSFDGPTVPFGS